jgi:hypothetical protein
MFYRRWIVANGWSEAAGLGTTFLIGQALAPRIELLSGVSAVLGAAAVAVALGLLLEGVLVGAAQERVLLRYDSRFPRWAWTVATAAGAGMAWLIGMVPSSVLALASSETAQSAPAVEPPQAVVWVLAAGLGLVTGPILGLAQWVVLRRHVSHAARWLWANALAWTVGMPVIFAGMDRVPWQGHAALRALSIYAVCGSAGVIVGAIHGRVLLRLLRSECGHTVPA